MMTGYERSDEDFQPLGWFRGYPIYATYLLVILHVAVLVGGELLQFAFPNADVFRTLSFSSLAVLHHLKIWQVVTYGFTHQLSFNFLIGMVLLVVYGRETERFFGRRVFLTLYGVLLLTVPVVLLLFGAIRGTDIVYPLGSFSMHFGLFVAFAVIYPSVQLFWGIPTKWIALILLGFYSLQFLVSSRDAPGLLPAFWASVLVGYFGARYFGAGGGLSFLSDMRQNFPTKRSPTGLKPRLQPRRLVESGVGTAEKRVAATVVRSSGADLHESIDPLLDKISKQGLASLTQSERAVLERARVSLLRKERGG